jgi:hypothetical protein
MAYNERMKNVDRLVLTGLLLGLGVTFVGMVADRPPDISNWIVIPLSVCIGASLFCALVSIWSDR